MKRSSIVISVVGGIAVGIIAVLRWALGSWGSTLFWLYVGGVGVMALLSVVGVVRNRRAYSVDSILMKASVSSVRGALNVVSSLALALAGWPSAILAITWAWPKGGAVSLIHFTGAASASYFGVAALASAGAFSAINLWVYQIDPTTAVRFAWLWSASLLVFLAVSALIGTKLNDRIRQSPGPVVPRLAASALGTLVGLVSSIAILDAHQRGVTLDVALLEVTARRILTFKKVVESFSEGGVPPFTLMEWIETAAGALYYWVVSIAILQAKRKDEDHLAVGSILMLAGRPEEALVHVRKLRQTTPRSKRLEASALMVLGRREEALKVAREAAQMDLDPRTPSEVLSAALIYPLSTAADARFLLEAALDARVSDGRLTLLIVTVLISGKLSLDETESIVASHSDRCEGRSYARALLAAFREELYETAQLLPDRTNSAIEEFFQIRFQFLINIHVLDDAAMMAWLQHASERASTHFDALAPFEVPYALEGILALSGVAEAISTESAAILRRTRDGALSICKERRLIDENALEIVVTSGRSITKTLLPVRLMALQDPVLTQTRRGMLYIAQERFDEAIQVITPLVAAGSGPASLAGVLARAYAAVGAPDKGMELLRERATQVNDGPAWLELGEFCLELGDEATAQQSYSAALLAGAEEARLPLARVLARLGRAAEARAEFEECVKRDATPEVSLELASFLSHSGDMRSAEALLRRIVDENPELAPARLELARSLSRQGRGTEALAVVDAALVIWPDNGELLREASSLVLPDDPERALGYLQRLVERTGTTQARAALGDLLFDQGRFQDASQQYSAVLEGNPDDGNARYRYALSLERVSANSVAEEQLRRNVAAEAASGERYEQLASFLHRQGRHDEARAELLRACQVEPDRTQSMALYCRWLADIDQTEEAVKRLRSGLQRSVDDEKLMDALADIALAQEDFETALATRRRIAETANNLFAWLKLGDTYLEAGDGQRAREAFELAISRYPDDPIARSKYARALWISGNAEEAERQYVSSTTLRGDLASPWLDLANFLSDANRPQEAQVALDKARELEPANLDVYLALPMILAPSGDRAALADDLMEGSKAVSDLREVLEAAARYYRSGDASVLAAMKDRIKTERGALFLNQIAWAACVEERVDEPIRAVAARAMELQPTAEIAHTLALTEFLIGAVDSALKSFARFTLLAERNQVEQVNEIVMLLCAAVRAGAADRTLEVMRETRKAGLWREWADALSALVLDVNTDKLVATVAQRLNLLRQALQRRER